MLKFDTAKKLALSGFLQPEQISVGQIYFDTEGLFGVVMSCSDDFLVVKWQNKKDYTTRHFDLSGCVYCPSAADIVLPESIICQNQYSTRIFRGWREFEDSIVLVENENHDEAKAEAWLLLYSSF